MEVKKLDEFLKSCCRICLSISIDEMIDSLNVVENFNKTIDQLLFECANLKMLGVDSHPRKLCEECTQELIMVARFREKCEISTEALNQIKRKINKQFDESEQVDIGTVGINEQEELSNTNSNNETLYENIEYAEDNVEYVIYDEIDVTENLIQDTNVESSIQNDAENVNIKSVETPKRKSSPKTKHKQKKETESKQTSKSIIKHHCKLCGAGFAQVNNYTRHLQTHNEPNDIEYSLVDMENFEETVAMSPIGADLLQPDYSTGIESDQPIEKNKKAIHACQFCGRKFPSQSLLATHIRIHTNERPFKCSMCAKSFKTQGALDLHVRRHNGVKPYICNVCDRGFVESSNLKVHMRVHTGEKPHRCVQCNRSFSRVFLLQIHMRTHTGEKPYQCPYTSCDKSFAQQGDLAAHKRIHSGERPHRCKICHKGFIKSSGLTQHMRRHSRPVSKINVNSVENSSVDNKCISNESVMICYKENNKQHEIFSINFYIWFFLYFREKKEKMRIEFEKICRTCMAKPMTLVSIWPSNNFSIKNTNIALDSSSLSFMLTTLIRSEVKIDDELPAKMCLDCISEMNQAYAFVQKCERSEKTLRSLLEQTTCIQTNPDTDKTRDASVLCSSNSVKSYNLNHNNSYQCSNCYVGSKTNTEFEHHSCDKQIELAEIEQIEYVQTVECISSQPKITEALVKDFIAERTMKFNCGDCNAIFSSKRSLSLHINSHKCTQQAYECDICQKVFIKKRYLVRHLQRMHQMMNKVCKVTFDDGNRPIHKRNYKCHLCSKAFTMSSSLKQHIRIHTQEKPYTCEVCGRSFTQNSNLRQHLMRHKQNKPFKCEKCSANFVTKGELNSHRRTHNEDPLLSHPFSCEVCKSRFTTSSSLVKHRRIHSGERPYQCDLCPLRFAALSTQKNHRRTHTGEKPFKCLNCHKSFTQRSDCISHLRTHTGSHMLYECKQRKLSCTDSKSLNINMIKHQMEQPVEQSINLERK
ncbi:zinc finger protein 84-like [Contarinia nasturtii]|uniref:zinc finger protein 84-like n=1 Tax=Contarinia nasturtii TaxID=265458 RepID=UPI0012D4AB0A|nr:zinc finger protein 84-like [Contarinia nasturtii]